MEKKKENEEEEVEEGKEGKEDEKREKKKIERRKQDDEDISIRQDKKELGRGRRQKEREGKMCPSFKHIHS